MLGGVRRAPGDAQVDWAAKYVAERLSATLAYLTQSIENLDAIATSDDANCVAAASVDGGEPLVVLTDGEVQRKAVRAEVDAAVAALPELRRSLEVWSAQVRGQATI
jgi:hypothetical protein